MIASLLKLPLPGARLRVRVETWNSGKGKGSVIGSAPFVPNLGLLYARGRKGDLPAVAPLLRSIRGTTATATPPMSECQRGNRQTFQKKSNGLLP